MCTVNLMLVAETRAILRKKMRHLERYWRRLIAGVDM
jgi:hypothetical protein